MVGAAVRGLSKILRKTGKKRPRGTPMAAGLAHRRAMLRGLSDPKKKSYLDEIKQPKIKGTKQTKAPKKPGYKRGLLEGILGTSAAIYTGTKLKDKQEAKAKDLKKATEEHKKKTKKKRRKYGKPHA